MTEPDSVVALKPKPKIIITAKQSAPPHWSEAAKRRWDRLPRAVREEVTAAEKARHEEQERTAAEFQPYRDFANERGLTLTQFLDRCTKVEDVMRLDAESGFMLIARHMAADQNIPPHQFARWAGDIFLQAAYEAGAFDKRH